MVTSPKSEFLGKIGVCRKNGQKSRKNRGGGRKKLQKCRVILACEREKGVLWLLQGRFRKNPEQKNVTSELGFRKGECVMKVKRSIKILSYVLSAAMLLSVGTVANAEASEDVSENVKLSEREQRLEEILNDYYDAVNAQENQLSAASSYQNENSIQEETVALLNEEGFEAYSVNDDTYASVQDTLDTDLKELGVDSEYSYIIVVDAAGEGNGNAQTRASYGGSFNYTYNGTTYSLRRLTVFASDDPKMNKQSTADLLKSASTNLIENCLNTAIYAYIDFLSGPLHMGTVASICGLGIGNFRNGQSATLTLTGATVWTREYTQVWSSYDQKWISGSSVEYVQSKSSITASYYDAYSNTPQIVTRPSSRTSYSKHWNTTWRNQYAVVGYLNSFLQYGTVGNVKYSYGGTVKITHYENF